MSSIFSKIVDGEIPAHVVAETTEFLAFLDVNPLTMGHVLVDLPYLQKLLLKD
jgi:histidine triad (HIT) family protein